MKKLFVLTMNGITEKRLESIKIPSNARFLNRVMIVFRSIGYEDKKEITSQFLDGNDFAHTVYKTTRRTYIGSGGSYSLSINKNEFKIEGQALINASEFNVFSKPLNIDCRNGLNVKLLLNHNITFTDSDLGNTEIVSGSDIYTILPYQDTIFEYPMAIAIIEYETE